MSDNAKNPHSDTSDDPNKPGAEGGESEATHKPPGAPADDDSPLGDTDQHSTGDA